MAKDPTTAKTRGDQPIHNRRFVPNPLVYHLLHCGGDMNDLAHVAATDEERAQFAQLVGDDPATAKPRSGTGWPRFSSETATTFQEEEFRVLESAHILLLQEGILAQGSRADKVLSRLVDETRSAMVRARAHQDPSDPSDAALRRSLGDGIGLKVKP